jgi:RNA polymerase sigma-70 factor (ECF subfamily)
LDEGTDIPHAVARSQELAMLTEAVQSLPARCRQIITLRKIYGLSIKDTAVELGLADHTVVVQTAIGIRKIGEYFSAHGFTEGPSQ